MKSSIRRLSIPLMIGFAGIILNDMLCDRVFPHYLILDFPFLMTAYLAFFEESEAALVPVFLLASMRDIFSGGNGGGIFFATLSFYFAARYFYRRLYVESDMFLLASIFFLLVIESISITLINVISYDFVPSLYFPITELLRVVINSLVAVPLFYWLVRRTGLLAYEL